MQNKRNFSKLRAAITAVALGLLCSATAPRASAALACLRCPTDAVGPAVGGAFDVYVNRNGVLVRVTGSTIGICETNLILRSQLNYSPQATGGGIGAGFTGGRYRWRLIERGPNLVNEFVGDPTPANIDTVLVTDLTRPGAACTPPAGMTAVQFEPLSDVIYHVTPADAAAGFLQFFLDATNLPSALLTNQFGNCVEHVSPGGTPSVFIAPPVTCTPPGDQTICQGSSATFTTTATGSGTLTYCWQKGCPGAGACLSTSASLTVNNAQASDGGCYTVTVTDGFGCTTTCSANLTVNPTPSCTLAGPTQICPGSTHTYTSTVLPAGGTVTYAWSISGNGTINGSTTGASVSVTAGSAAPGQCSSYTLSLSVTRNTCPGTPCTLPVNFCQPACSIAPGSATLCAGATQHFVLTTSGTSGALTISWTKNGVAFAGNVTAIDAVTPATGTDTYAAHVVDAAGCITDCQATLTANPTPTCTVAGPTQICPGSTHTYTSTVLPAGGTVTYAWSVSGNGTISGSTTGASVSVVAGSAAAGQCSSFTVSLSVTRNGCPAAGPCTLPVNFCQPACSIAPGSATLCTGASQHFTLTTSGTTGALTISWTKNGAAFAGNVTSIDATAPGDGITDTYAAHVVDSIGCITDCQATLRGDKPTCTIAPLTALLCSGSPQQFCVTAAGGSGNKTYSWTKNGAPFDGGSTCINATAPVGGVTDTYVATVTDGIGCVTTCSATLVGSNCLVRISVEKDVVCRLQSAACPDDSDPSWAKTAYGAINPLTGQGPAFCYRFKVCNIGDLPVTINSLTDLQPNGLPAGIDLATLQACFIGVTLNPAQCTPFCHVGNVEIDNGLTNIFTVTACTPGGTVTCTNASDTNRVVVYPIGITCAKSVKVDGVNQGSTVHLQNGGPYSVVFTVCITNTGVLPLANISLTESLPYVHFTVPAISLDPGQGVCLDADPISLSCNGSSTNIQNNVTVHANVDTTKTNVCSLDHNGQPIETQHSCPASVTLACTPHITVEKDVVCRTTAACPDDSDPGWAKTATGAVNPVTGQGPSFCYRFKVCNDGNIPVTITSLTDLQPNGAQAGIDPAALQACFIGVSLDPGTCTPFCHVGNVELDHGLTNIFTATGCSSSGGITTCTNASDTNKVTVIPVGITCVVKLSVDSGTPAPTPSDCYMLDGVNPHTLQFSVCITNTGGVPLAHISYSDTTLGLVNVGDISLPAHSGTCVDIGPAITATCTNMSINVTVHGVVDTSNGDICPYDHNGQIIEASSQCPACTHCTPPGACRTTGGGKQDQAVTSHLLPNKVINVDPRANPLQAKFVTHGGQVGAPVGSATEWDPESPCIKGEWEHVRHFRPGLDGNFHARKFDSLQCACLACLGDPDPSGVLSPGKHNQLCNAGDRYCGPEPRKAPANKMCFSGIGAYTLDNGRNGKRSPDSVAFRVDIEDHGEPGGSGPKGNKRLPADRYRIRIYHLIGDKNSGASTALRMAIACTKANTPLRDGTTDPLAADGVTTALGDAFPIGSAYVPFVDDGGELDKGNRQIHPQIKQCP